MTQVRRPLVSLVVLVATFVAAMAGIGCGMGDSSTAYLGFEPAMDSLESADGCVVASTTPGSPADQAGLKSGDIIIRWDEREITKFADVLAALGESKSNQLVQLQVRRGEETLTLPTTLGSRKRAG